jgi:hypothetical protein
MLLRDACFEKMSECLARGGRYRVHVALGALLMWCCTVVQAQQQTANTDEQTDLAKKLANPVAALISIPFQYNHDDSIGASNGSKDYLNIQPVIPISISPDWNLITRTILPIVNLRNTPSPGDKASGLGDTTASQFISPKQPTSTGWICGAGPAELLPTASDRVLGTGKWGLGPTFVALKQEGPITYGILANHIWSVAGDSNRASVSSTFIQPFLSYITKTRATFVVNTETTYDWRASAWSVPINIGVAQMLKFGPQILQVQVGARYWATAPSNGPEGWGWRLAVTLLYPK